MSGYQARPPLIRPTSIQSHAYIENLGDVERIALALDEPIRTAFAIGVLAGLRTSKIRALRWESIDFDKRQMVIAKQSRERQIGPPRRRDQGAAACAELLSVLRAGS